MEEVSISLEDLSIHRLNVIPDGNQEQIEFQLHATIDDINTETIERIENNEFVPKSIVGELSAPADSDTDTDS